MDLKQLRITQALPGVKLTVFALFLAQVLVGIGCAVLAMYSPQSEHSSLLQASAYALGAGLPLFALALLLVTARTGVRSIEARAVKFLAAVIPTKLQQLELTESDPAACCSRFNGKFEPTRHLRRNAAPSRLDLSLAADGASAIYRLSAELDSTIVELWISVDIALTQATVCLFLENEKVPQCGLAGACKSTLEGAEKSGEYTVDECETVVKLGDKEYRKLILRRKHFSEEFLWDSAQMFFFATDLGLMVASYLRECKGLLTTARLVSEGEAAETLD